MGLLDTFSKKFGFTTEEDDENEMEIDEEEIDDEEDEEELKSDVIKVAQSSIAL